MRPSPSRKAAPLPPSPELLANAADALEGYSQEVESLGEVLCSNAELIESHLHRLQSIDRLSQCLSQLALVLRSDDPDGAIDAVTIGTLQQQLRPMISEKAQDDVFADLS